jgi:hypothetical protein
VHEISLSSQSASRLRFKLLISGIQVRSGAAWANHKFSLLHRDEAFRIKCSADVGSAVRPLNSADVCSVAIVSLSRIYGIVYGIHGNVKIKL